MNDLDPTTQDPRVLHSFYNDIRSIVKQGGTEAIVTDAVADRLRALLSAAQDFLPERFVQPSSEGYAMYPLHVEPDGGFCVAAAVWDVGQITPIHDHGTWGVIGIYSGAEHEVRYAHSGSVGGGPPVYLCERDVPAGIVTVCCTSDADLHQVSCTGDVPCVGIHIYGGDIGAIERRAFDGASGAVKLFVTSWAIPSIGHRGQIPTVG